MARDKVLDRALDRLRRPGTTLVLTHHAVRGRVFSIQPDGIRINDELAQRILEHSQVQPYDDGLLSGCTQSWRLGNWRTWTW